MTQPLLVVPPDLADDAGCLWTNPERDRLLAQLRAAGVPFESAAAETARETAARLRDGHGRVAVVSGPRDGRAVAILVRALRRAGIDAEVLRTGLDGLLPTLPAVHRADGSGRVAPPELPSWPATPTARSPLPVGLPVDDRKWREAFLRRVAAGRPACYPRLLVALGLHDLGANPREDAYAELGLLAHNRDLLVNIVERW